MIVCTHNISRWPNSKATVWLHDQPAKGTAWSQVVQGFAWRCSCAAQQVAAIKNAVLIVLLPRAVAGPDGTQSQQEFVPQQAS